MFCLVDIKAQGRSSSYKLYRYGPPHRVGLLRCFGLKTIYTLGHLGLESRMVFNGTAGVYDCIYRFNSQ